MKEKAVAKAVVSASADGPRKFTHINASAASADGPRKFTHINASASVDGSRISSRDKKKVVNYAEESVEATSRALTQNRKVLNTNVKVLPKRMPRPTRNSENELLFDDHKEFKPNLTPQEIIEMGSFGGTYFRPIHSSVTGLDYRDEHKEFEDLGWYTNVNIKRMVTSNVYNNDVNKFRCSCGGDLEMWESSNWITSIDPYGYDLSTNYVHSYLLAYFNSITDGTNGIVASTREEEVQTTIGKFPVLMV